MRFKWMKSKLFQLSPKEVVVAISVTSQNYNNVFLLKTTKDVLLASIIQEGLNRAKDKCHMCADLVFEYIKLEDGSCNGFLWNRGESWK